MKAVPLLDVWPLAFTGGAALYILSTAAALTVIISPIQRTKARLPSPAVLPYPRWAIDTSSFFPSSRRSTVKLDYFPNLDRRVLRGVHNIKSELNPSTTGYRQWCIQGPLQDKQVINKPSQEGLFKWAALHLSFSSSVEIKVLSVNLSYQNNIIRWVCQTKPHLGNICRNIWIFYNFPLTTRRLYRLALYPTKVIYDELNNLLEIQSFRVNRVAPWY